MVSGGEQHRRGLARRGLQQGRLEPPRGFDGRGLQLAVGGLAQPGQAIDDPVDRGRLGIGHALQHTDLAAAERSRALLFARLDRRGRFEHPLAGAVVLLDHRGVGRGHNLDDRLAHRFLGGVERGERAIARLADRVGPGLSNPCGGLFDLEELAVELARQAPRHLGHAVCGLIELSQPGLRQAFFDGFAE